MENNMSEYTTANIIDFALDGDSVNMQIAVDDIMREKVAEILNKRKEEVARNLFGVDTDDQ
jgi:hypothetical protein